MEVFAKIINGFYFLPIFAKSSILDVWQDFDSPLKPVAICRKSSISGVWQGFELAFVAINYFRKSVGYLFTKFDWHIPPYIKQHNIVHGQISVILYSTYLLNNKSYNTGV